VLPDPSAFELPLLSTTISIALDEQDSACAVHQEGLGGVTGRSGDDVLSEAWTAAEDRVRSLRSILEQS
jgi:exosome complex component RRP43